MSTRRPPSPSQKEKFFGRGGESDSVVRTIMVQHGSTAARHGVSMEPEPMENEEYLDLLEQVLTPEIQRILLGYTAARCRWLARIGIDLGKDGPIDLAHDAILATAQGRRKWDRSKCALSTHLCGIVKSRTFEMVRMHQARIHIPLEDPETGEPSISADGTSSTIDALIVRELVVEVADNLHKLAEADEQVMWLLMAYEDGYYERREIVEATSLTASDYDNALKRLKRLVGKLPEELRQNIHEVLRGRV